MQRAVQCPRTELARDPPPPLPSGGSALTLTPKALGFCDVLLLTPSQHHVVLIVNCVARDVQRVAKLR